MKSGKVVPFRFKTFSEKQLLVLGWWMLPKYKHYTALICDGAVRSGKTVSMSFSFVNWATECFNGMNFAICGKTIQSCRRNVVQPVKQMLLSRGYAVQDNRSENVLTVSRTWTTKDGNKRVATNYFYVFGGKDEAAQDLIQGVTLAGVLFDEVALMPQSFVNQATARCSVEGAKFWFNCNPDSPFHWFNEEWIKKSDEKNALHLHFTMNDNLTLSEEVKKRYESLYSGLFYKRYILGLWVMADGVVYPMFDMDKHVKTVKQDWTRTFISCDFGIQNATTFGIFGYYQPTKQYHQIASYYHNGRTSGQKTVAEYVDELIKFIKQNNVMPEYITVDPSAAPLIVELRKNDWFSRHNIRLIPAKNNVQVGIQLVSYLLSQNKLSLDPTCKNDIEEFGCYVWDEDKLNKGVEEVVKLNDHAMDKIRYAVMTDSIIFRTFDKQVQCFSGKGIIE
jgi:PBSX family phage terminase large subunit